MIVACNSDDNRRPQAQSKTVNLIEDTVATGSLTGTDPEGAKVSYLLLDNTRHGSLWVDPNNGAFLYVPVPDFFGEDSFSYVVSDGKKSSSAAVVTFVVESVNDAPMLAAIPDLHNSAESSTELYPLAADDVDGDPLTFAAVSDNPAVATVEVDSSAKALVITWRDYGEAQIQVTVNDGVAGNLRSFRFSVGDVKKSRTISTNPEDAIYLSNTTGDAVEFRLTHNGFPMFQSDQEILGYVYSMPNEFTDEPFERKLWRFVRDNVYHAVPLYNNWPFDPWVTVNSLGWGLCGQVAEVYMRIARNAGYTARMWGLTGHVVPEIRIADRWQLLDPDLAIYYMNGSGQIAGVEELATEATLITLPVDPIFDVDAYPAGYSDLLAEIYGTSDDNVAASETSRLSATHYQSITLPPGATLTYPVRLFDSVEGVDGNMRYPVPHHLQAALQVNGGWSGELNMPWVLWGVSGDGRVAVGDEEFEAGSQALVDRLRSGRTPVTSVRVVSAGSQLTFALFINALRYELAAENQVAVTGKDVWAIDVSRITPPASQLAPWNGSLVYRKIRARR